MVKLGSCRLCSYVSCGNVCIFWSAPDTSHHFLDGNNNHFLMAEAKGHIQRVFLTVLLFVRVGIQEMLERVAGEKGLVWEQFFEKLKENKQWHVEVY